MLVGRVAELWRHPVKSLGGERIEAASVDATFGIPGDRSWALRDEKDGEIRSAKNFPALLTLSARCLAEPSTGDEVPPIEVLLRDGRTVRGGDPDASQAISRELGREFQLVRRRPASDLDHYRRTRRIEDFDAEIRTVAELLPEEPVPPMPELVADLATYATPPGTYFDAFPLHLLTTASIAELARRAEGSRIDVRRFRPNVLIDTASARGFVENDWVGSELRVGETTVQVVMAMMRCGMTIHAQGDLPKDPRIMRALVREAGMNLGIGVMVTRAGRIAIGDEVELLRGGA